MHMTGSLWEFDYEINQPYEVEWEPELYWSGWDNPLDLQMEYSEEFGYYDPSYPYFPYFFLDHWLTGSESRPTEITDLAWWNERTFVPYTLCISHFRPDRLTMMLTIDPTRSEGGKGNSTPFPVTLVADWSNGESQYAHYAEIENPWGSDNPFFEVNSFYTIDYSDVTEADVWGDLRAADTGSAE